MTGKHTNRNFYDQFFEDWSRIENLMKNTNCQNNYDGNKAFSMYAFFRNANIVDNMIRMMESYTDQLEHLVDERTMQLAEEKAKTDELLYKMLPK